jgi:hypothetical protein
MSTTEQKLAYIQAWKDMKAILKEIYYNLRANDDVEYLTLRQWMRDNWQDDFIQII